MENQVVEQLPLGKIKPDPSQPRKTITEDSIKELSESISELGVIQPISVRKSGKSFTIIVGERRYRASKLAKKKTIPCIVREKLDAETIREIQIVENLQREDVEPIEEAESIAFLLEKYSPEEIATRIGRTKNFVYGRIKLAQLVGGFKNYVKSKELTISLAIGIATLPQEDQQMILEGMGERFRAHYVQNALNQNAFDLDGAPFKLENEKLIPKVGACTLCPFNSANQGNLFGDDKQICTKSSCYSTKKSKSFLNLIEKVKLDGRLLIPNFRRHSIDDSHNRLAVSIMEENGLKIHLRDDIDILEEPTKPTVEAIKKERYWKDYSDKELKNELAKAMQGYKEELKGFKNGTKNGFSIGVLVDANTYRYKEVLMKIKTVSPDDVRSLPIKKKKMDDCTPSEKIQKMNARENRKKHLEANKQFEEVARAIRETDYVDSKKGLSADEMVAFCILLYEDEIGWHMQNEHFKSFYGNRSNKSTEKLVEQFKKNFNKGVFNKLVRIMLTKNVHFGEENHNNNFVNSSFYTALKGYRKKEMTAIEATYNEKRVVREKRLKERIEVLQKQVGASKGA